jgi:hypothetical protein
MAILPWALRKVLIAHVSRPARCSRDRPTAFERGAAVILRGRFAAPYSAISTGGALAGPASGRSSIAIMQRQAPAISTVAAAKT